MYVSQSASEGTWAYLGTFAFAAGGDQWVRLGDNYVGDDDEGRYAALDALKVVPPNAGDDDDDDAGPGDDDDTDPGGDDDSLPGGNGDDDDHSWESGCGCASEGNAAPTGTAALLAALMVLVARRRTG